MENAFFTEMLPIALPVVYTGFFQTLFTFIPCHPIEVCICVCVWTYFMSWLSWFWIKKKCLHTLGCRIWVQAVAVNPPSGISHSQWLFCHSSTYLSSARGGATKVNSLRSSVCSAATGASVLRLRWLYAFVHFAYLKVCILPSLACIQTTRVLLWEHVCSVRFCLLLAPGFHISIPSSSLRPPPPPPVTARECCWHFWQPADKKNTHIPALSPHWLGRGWVAADVLEFEFFLRRHIHAWNLTSAFNPCSA